MCAPPGTSAGPWWIDPPPVPDASRPQPPRAYEDDAPSYTRVDVVDTLELRDPTGNLCETDPGELAYTMGVVVDEQPIINNVGVAMADKPEGPYIKKPGRIFEAEKPGKHWMVAEDPFIWFSKKHGNRYYAVTRDVVGTFTGSSGGICLFQSGDGLNWKPAAHPKVLESRFALEDGSLSNSNIERPALLIENDEPTYLFGATDGYRKGGKISSNVQIPLVP